MCSQHISPTIFAYVYRVAQIDAAAESLRRLPSFCTLLLRHKGHADPYIYKTVAMKVESATQGQPLVKRYDIDPLHVPLSCSEA